MTIDTPAVRASVLIGFVLVIGIPVFLALTESPARYRDVSREPLYAVMIDQRCTVLKGLRAHGYTAVRGKRGETDGVVITTLPSYQGGSEITFKLDVPKGTVLRITSAKKCTNCLFGRTEYGFKVDSIPRLAAFEIFGEPEVLAPEELACTKGPE